MSELTKAEKQKILKQVKKLLEKIWGTPYREDQNGNWNVDYLKGHTTIEYFWLKNFSQYPHLYFNYMFEVHEFKMIIEMFLNLLMKQDGSE